MRLSRKAGLRPFYKTITFRGEAEGCYCDIKTGASTVYRCYGGSEDTVLELHKGTVIILYATDPSTGKAALCVNERAVRYESGTQAMRYVVVGDATIEFGFNDDLPASINITCPNTIWFRVGEAGFFSQDAGAQIAERGMTWREWIQGLKYINHTGGIGKEGFFISTSGGKVCYGSGSDDYYFHVTKADGTQVIDTDTIIDGHFYKLDHTTGLE